MALTHIEIYQYQGDIGSTSLATLIEGNRFLGGVVGIELDDAHDVDIVGNRLDGQSGAGINGLEDAIDNAVFSNRIVNCNVGVQWQAGADTNVVHGNIFRNNATDISDSGTGNIDTDN